jgi:hypothetical protein
MFLIFTCAGNWHTPAITCDGVLYVPQDRCDHVHVCSEDGVELQSVPSKAIGLGSHVRSVAHDELSGLLLLGTAGGDPGSNVVAAVNREHATVEWVTQKGRVKNCHGIALLSHYGVLFATSYQNNELCAFALSDGHLISSVPVLKGAYIACDPINDVIYVSCWSKDVDYTVAAFLWCSTGVGAGEFKERGRISALDHSRASRNRPLAYFPARIGAASTSFSVVSDDSCSGFLVVGTCNTADLDVISLPDLSLLGTHTLPRSMRVYGLAGDPCCTALAVMDASSRTVHVVSWPLPLVAATLSGS